ncbi:hypothetical protein DOTSEDRAFT_27775 [Dothistroma septosporum NZE10]|uniref:Uncharacterized protein n=1 Tax=Dothistroma septosporum (strain NZE10 / CBS 128990) TaxID=675120 RepID=N1PEW2_DOTSN|nr:hypothetical protein DOTSEDRAFT_27775 [Dothistroma septosporum NZE10]
MDEKFSIVSTQTTIPPTRRHYNTTIEILSNTMSWSTDPGTNVSATLQYARHYFVEHPPATFVALNSRDQTQKLCKRQAIETDWNAYIEDCVPEDIKPRQATYKGHKARRGDGIPAAPWWQWSIDVMKKLDRLGIQAAEGYEEQVAGVRRASTQDIKMVVAVLLNRLDQGPLGVFEIEESEDESNRDFEEQESPYVERVSPDEVSFAQTEGFEGPVQAKRAFTCDPEKAAAPSLRKGTRKLPRTMSHKIRRHYTPTEYAAGPRQFG